jgi:peptidoglycan/xylan/chitin deacetylase (PgdA/CDA1 family)
MRKLKLFLAETITRMAWELFSKGRKKSGRIPILCYHRVLPEIIEDADDPIYTVLPEQFEAQMAFLASEGFTSLSLQEFGEMARGSQAVGSRAVLVTFDDGYADMHAVAWPLARKYGIRLNLFISTGLIGDPGPVVMTKNGYHLHTKEDKPLYYQAHLEKFPHLWRPLSWEELGEMGQTGVNLGFHGHSHRNLAYLTPEEITDEVTTGIEIFRQELGYCPEFFAFPYGGFEANTSEIAVLLQNKGFDFIFTTIKGRARLPSTNRIFTRISILQQDTLDTFRLKLYGAYDWLGPAETLFRRTKAFLLRK